MSTLFLLMGCYPGRFDALQADPAPAPEPRAEPKVELALAPLDKLGARPDDCTLDAAALEPLLRREQEGAKVSVVKEGRLVESFTWPDGTPVRVTQGGCAHIGITYTFGVEKVPSDPYAAALERMERVQLAQSDGFTLVGALKEAGKLDDSGYFPCGDATCDVRISTEGSNPAVVVAYDFAL